ncbi:MAG: FRG domain-containing protein [Nitrospirae bacterium]|nr:FRG domain-containing protein [Nitrospirota bacterium]
MPDFYEEPINTWANFLKKIEKLEENPARQWVFRGQFSDLSLKTTFERACEDYCLDTKRKMADIESTLIKDFQRRYHGENKELVISDTLYCLSVMQHHGAPTRLLDFNYSPFIALFFSLEAGFKRKDTDCKDPVVWCINSKWCRKQAEKRVGKVRIKMRNEKRDENSFKRLYMKNAAKFVFLENALSLNRRLIIQQGVFLCPGNVSIPFEKNLKALPEWHKKENIIKFVIKMKDPAEYKKALEKLYRMNISHESLFPGLDGVAKSLKSKLPIYEKISEKGWI